MTPEQIKQLAKQAGGIDTLLGSTAAYIFTHDEMAEFVLLVRLVRRVREVPAGYQLVPIEPTQAMLDAGRSTEREWWKSATTSEPVMCSVYKAMLEAAKGETK